MESLLLFLAIFLLLGLLACELKDPLAPTPSPAAGPLSPPPRRKEAGPFLRIRRALARSRPRARSLPSSGPSSSPAFLPPSAAPFATSTPVLSWPAWRRNLDRKPLFLDKADEAKNGRMYPDFDPILGWRWRAYPKGTYEARQQQLRKDRESNMPAGQVELSTQSPATVPAPPPPTIRAPIHDTSAPLANEAPASLPPLPPAAPWAGPTSQPSLPPSPPTRVELQAAPPVIFPSFSEQFAGLCAATQHLPLPWPRLSFAEQFALSCRETQRLPLPFPLPPPSLPQPPPMVQAQAPASFAAPPPPPTIDFGFNLSAGSSTRSTSRAPLRRAPPAVRARIAEDAAYNVDLRRLQAMAYLGMT